MEKKELLIVMPVYNEDKSIEKVLDGLESPDILSIADILVVDDASSDATAQMVKGRPCTLITHVFNLGYGSALQTGYRYAVRRDYSYVIQLDGDGQHDVCNIPVIFRKLKEKDADGQYPDLVLASRFMEGSLEFPVSVLRRWAYALFRVMIRMASGRTIADPATGLQGLSRRAFHYYSRSGHFDDRYPDANMILQMLLLKFCVAEVPAVMHARTDGKSMHSGLEPVWYMLRMIFCVLAVIFRIKILKTDTEADFDNVDRT